VAALSRGLGAPLIAGRPPDRGLSSRPMRKRVYIETYGCQMNVADSELMFGVLGRAGYERTDDPALADVMLTLLNSNEFVYVY